MHDRSIRSRSNRGARLEAYRHPTYLTSRGLFATVLLGLFAVAAVIAISVPGAAVFGVVAIGLVGGVVRKGLLGPPIPRRDLSVLRDDRPVFQSPDPG